MNSELLQTVRTEDYEELHEADREVKVTPTFMRWRPRYQDPLWYSTSAPEK